MALEAAVDADVMKMTHHCSSFELLFYSRGICRSRFLAAVWSL